MILDRVTCKKCGKVMVSLYFHTSISDKKAKGGKKTLNVKTDIYLCRWCKITRDVKNEE